MFNGCKTAGCSNLGNPNLADYEQTTRLGYSAFYCPLCGSFPPYLETSPIINLIKQQRKESFTAYLSVCNQCADYFFKHYRNRATSSRYGKTGAGSERRVCTKCKKLFTLLNVAQLEKRLQPLFNALVQGSKASNIREITQLSPRQFYRDLSLLSEILRHFSRICEEQWLAGQEELTITTLSHRLNCRSGVKAQKGTYVWFLMSSEANTGYQLLCTHNLYSGERKTSGVYHPTVEEPPITFTKGNLLELADKTYSKILSREKFDELYYSSSEYSQTVDGILVRPVYAAHCHFQLLKSMLRTKSHTTMFLEHESFIRGACIWAFSKQIKADKSFLYYFTYSKLGKESEDTSNLSKRTLSWWNDQWIQDRNSHWVFAYAYLSHKGRDPEIPEKLDWNEEFWQQFELWLPEEARRKIKFKILTQWMEIFRYFYNYVHEQRVDKSIIPDNVDVKNIGSLVKFINQHTQ